MVGVRKHVDALDAIDAVAARANCAEIARENVRVAGDIDSAWRREAEGLLQDLGLGSFRGETVATLPYGIRKKIEVVRALAAQPKLLLLDEPAAGLNPTETASLQEFLMDVSKRGISLLVVEHDMSFVRSLCDRAIVLNFGRQIYEGPTSSVQDDPLVLEAYLGPRHATPTSQVAVGGV